MKKINKLLFSIFVIMFSLSLNVYASTNFRYYTDEEISNYTKWNITEYNYNNIKNTRIVNAEEKIYDFGELLTDEQEEAIKLSIDNFIIDTNMDFVLVTLAESDYSDYQDEIFADDFYDYNDFGIGPTHDGILMLIDIRNDVAGNRYVYYSTTGQAILYYDDSRISGLVDDFVYGSGISYGIDENTYPNGICSAINGALNYYNLGIPSSNRDAYIDEYGNYIYEAGYYRSTLSPIQKIENDFFIILFWSAIATLIFFFINKSKLKNVKVATTANLYLKNDSVEFNTSNDTFVTTHTTSYVVSSSSSGGGGSSSHHSSSGGSHGGGGGHF